MRLPDFLVIGAMKAGSTTLYHDLLTNPGIFLPDKEVSYLLNDLSAEQYAAPYKSATSSQLCGDVSTLYAMLPDHPGVVSRAKRLLPHLSKIIYLVREPVSRSISHHHHMSVWRGEGRMGRDIDRCVLEHPSIVEYSCYAKQLRPWVDAFGLDSVLVLRFEDFVRDRTATIERACGFLQVTPRVDQINEDVAHNRSEGKPVLTDFWDGVRHLNLYRKALRPFLSLKVRDKLRELVLPSAPPCPEPPSLATVEYIIERTRDDVELLRRMLGHDKPLWDLDAVFAKHRARVVGAERIEDRAA